MHEEMWHISYLHISSIDTYYLGDESWLELGKLGVSASYLERPLAVVKVEKKSNGWGEHWIGLDVPITVQYIG